MPTSTQAPLKDIGRSRPPQSSITDQYITLALVRILTVSKVLLQRNDGGGGQQPVTVAAAPGPRPTKSPLPARERPTGPLHVAPAAQ